VAKSTAGLFLGRFRVALEYIKATHLLHIVQPLMKLLRSGNGTVAPTLVFDARAPTILLIVNHLCLVITIMYSGFFDSSVRQLIRCDYISAGGAGL